MEWYDIYKKENLEVDSKVYASAQNNDMRIGMNMIE
jgi:hypothetical protein